jgi:hypothetical protein
MTPILQQTQSDCSRAAFASILDMAYDSVPPMCGLDIDNYNQAITNLLSEHGLFMVQVTDISIIGTKITFYPSRTDCLLTVKSKRFPGKNHHVCGRVICTENQSSGLWEWRAEITHDPYKFEEPYELVSVDFIFKAL